MSVFGVALIAERKIEYTRDIIKKCLCSDSMAKADRGIRKDLLAVYFMAEQMLKHLDRIQDESLRLGFVAEDFLPTSDEPVEICYAQINSTGMTA